MFWRGREGKRLEVGSGGEDMKAEGNLVRDFDGVCLLMKEWRSGDGGVRIARYTYRPTQ